jgi:D-sedoheptulose 7-phosphate isomerase
MIVLGLGDNIPSLTAYANDEGYDRVFAEPAISLMKKDDVLIAISGSGNSPNVLRAVEVANNVGGTTLGLTGFHGGKLKGLVDHCLVVPSDSMEMIEDFHMIVDHILTICLRG